MEDFERLDLRVGRIVSAAPLEGARRPAYRLEIDFGPGGHRGSSAQLTRTYPDPSALVGRLVVAVVNFPPRRVADFRSEVLSFPQGTHDDQVDVLSYAVEVLNHLHGRGPRITILGGGRRGSWGW